MMLLLVVWGKLTVRAGGRLGGAESPRRDRMELPVSITTNLVRWLQERSWSFLHRRLSDRRSWCFPQKLRFFPFWSAMFAEASCIRFCWHCSIQN